MTKERRRYPRAAVEFNITVETPAGPWQGRTMNLSPVGIKVAPLRHPLLLPVGTSVQIRFPTHDREHPFSLQADVVRADSDGIAFRFGSVGAQEFKRLKSLVDSNLQREWQELLQQIEARHAPAAGASSLVDSDRSELDRWQALLDRLGFDSLQLPSDGVLTGQWRDFLKRLEAQADEKPTKQSPR
ncbi:MAG: PilZ domain-containing protein [Candidatus Rokubacteria bacterium]|nr:PilZ domain-containing protein [Candidatus Rokubacteria bacterium]